MSMLFPTDLAEVIGSCVQVTPGRCHEARWVTP